ncbi:MAG: hypothetical protein ACI9SC_002965 [Gammaproteobacteria bacterium]|jgi:hypothetical protein
MSKGIHLPQIINDIGWKPLTFVYIHTDILHFRELICQWQFDL